ncbi:ABC transporter permease [Actinoallomurus iriomotensis]|uniref:Peptide ABC transporter permease n=1 Tax=Actinoallomurus iriomotensis TaxID=478107 RepID=A0A9W6S915_9ACTN|nr:ABC transporter permease [Actinoallomurus iriomotensis]GLY78237.1 peptide ABC transporter permease [Actinoallomurus iriomotensis]GLY87880.1 peptide ABC transporter permease [Actinoallomurus iriomotensis]
MLRFLIRRILFGILVLWIVTLGVFLLFFATSDDPAARFAGKSATPATLALVRHRLGLDDPLPVQYWHFLTRLLRGDLGYSFATQSPVTDMIKQALPASLSLILGAAVLWLAAGIVAGVISATRARTLLDRGITLAVLLGISMPAFIVGLTLSYVFAVKLQIFPQTQYVPIQNNPLQWFEHMVLPWITLALLQSAIYTRLTRGSLLDVLGEDYIRTARAKGLPERRVIYRHGLRSALTPVVTQAGVDIGVLIGGTLVTESVFGLQGIGQLTVQSLTIGDLPVIMGVVLIAAFFVVLGNLVVDVVYSFLDPRVRLS